MAIKSLGNVVVTYGGTDITAYCNKADLSSTIERLDVTDLAATAKSTIAVDAEWTIASGGAWASGISGVEPRRYQAIAAACHSRRRSTRTSARSGTTRIAPRKSWWCV